MILDIFRNGIVVGKPKIDEQTIYSGEFMGMDKIQAQFITNSPVDFLVDDYIVHDGYEFKIKDATNCDPSNNFTFHHNITFYGEIYDLYDVPLSHLGRTTLSYTGTPLDLLGLIVDCLNEWFGGGWSVGDVSDIAEPQTFNFTEVSCRVALTMVAEAFKLEYKVKDKKVHLTETVGVLQPITLMYGRGLGLQKLKRDVVDQSYATVWRFYGGNKNIPANYRNGMDRITDGDQYNINTNLYGRKGGSVTFEDVFPQRTSQVESTPDMNTVIDTTIDFDLETAFIVDGSAKIVFKTGALAGDKEYVITGYNSSSKAITFGTIKEDDTGYELPNESRYPEIGDSYTIVGIQMPQEYVTAAEEEVKRRGIEHAKKNCYPPVAFPLIIDEKYIREMGNANLFQPGDSFNVKSESLGVDAPLRLQAISYPLVNRSNITGVISDVLQYTTQERIVKDVKQNKRITTQAQRSAIFARQVADEIANAAIISQFKKTYVGDRAVLSGAFVVGNPEDGEVGGVSGVDSGGESVVFFSGSTFADRYSAPFNVRRNGEGYATKFTFRDGCKIGQFTIENGYLRTSDFSSGAPTGVLISDQGISSRNAGASLIPPSTGISINASFFGSTDEEEISPSFPDVSPAYAGVIGVKWNSLTQKALDNLKYCRGVYGGLFTSVKNLGARFESVRWSGQGGGTEPMTYDDYMVIIQDNRDSVALPETPDHGMVVMIKNARAATVNVLASGSNFIINLNNTTSTSIAIQSGEVIGLIYHSGSQPVGGGSSFQRWLVLSRQA